MKKAISVILSILILISVYPHALAASGQRDYGSYTYKLLTDGTIEITRYNGYGDGAITIPNEIDGSIVSSVGKHAFMYASIDELVITADRITIQEAAFFGCSVKTVSITADELTIGSKAFSCCSNIENFLLKANNTTIGHSAFMYATPMTKYAWALRDASTSSTRTEIGENGFFSCGVTNMSIPGDYISIGKQAFSCSSSLESITILCEAIDVGNAAFMYCSDLKSINLPNAYKTTGRACSIDDHAFFSCGLESFVVPPCINSIGDHAFSCSSSFSRISIPSTVTRFGDNVFLFCASGLVADVVDGSTADTYCQNNRINRESTTDAEILAKGSADFISDERTGHSSEFGEVITQVPTETPVTTTTSSDFVMSTPVPAEIPDTAEGWICPVCNNNANGNFCNNCGSAKPHAESNEWNCPVCGADASGKFCSNCGAAKISAALETTFLPVTTATPVPQITPVTTAKPIRATSSDDVAAMVLAATTHKPSPVNASPDKYTYYIDDYVGLNLANVGYTSLGGDRLERYGSAVIEFCIVTPDGTYVDIEDDDEISKYIVVGQSIAPNSELKLIYRKDSNGNEYSNLIEYQNIDVVDLYVARLDGTISGDIIPYEPASVNLSPNKYSCYVRDYIGKNLALVGYTSLGGDRLDEYSAARVELCIVATDGTYIDIEDADLLQQYVVVAQNIAPNTEINLVHLKDSNGNEYSNLIDFQSVELIDLLVTRLDGTMYNKQVTYESTPITVSPNKYTHYIRNYVGKNLATVGYTSLGGERLDAYGDARLKLVLVTPDRSVVDIEDIDQLASYVVIAQDIAPNSEMKITYRKDSEGNEYSNLIDSMSHKKITLTLQKVNLIPTPVPTTTSDITTVNTTIPASHQAIQESGEFLYCVLDDSSVAIVGYTGSASSLDIPDMIDGHTVKVIGNEAFKGCTTVKEIDMSKSITTIGDAAFEECVSLRRIYYMGSSSIVAIGTSAFKNCRSLEEIDIPKGLTAIAVSAFQGCTDLERAYYMGSCKATSIGKNAFKDCTSLEEVDIPKGTSVISESAFEGCSNMERAYYMGSSKVEIIEKNAFKNCTSLEEIDIPKKTTVISESAFEGCTDMERAYYMGSSKVTTIEKNAFKNCASLEYIDAPKTLVTVGESAFEGCTALEMIYYLDAKQVTFGVNAFADCPNLSNKPKTPTK